MLALLVFPFLYKLVALFAIPLRPEYRLPWMKPFVRVGRFLTEFSTKVPKYGLPISTHPKLQPYSRLIVST